MPIMQTVIQGSGGSAPAHYIEKTVDANGVLKNGSIFIDLTGVTDLNDKVLAYIYYSNTDLPTTCSIDIEKITGANVLEYAFMNSSVTVLKMDKTVYIGSATLGSLCRSSNITTFTCESLKTIDGAGFGQAFRASSLSTDLRFPALKDIQSSTFGGMLTNVSNQTVHFPSNMQTTVEALTGYPNFGGTNTTVLFDLPATVILTGANSVNYERSPKDDTATALAWRVQDTGTAPNLVIDWTPYYTSGTTDPTVSDTIYSDAACTTTVTTISSIA